MHIGDKTGKTKNLGGFIVLQLTAKTVKP